jgi:hypothetical protein
MQGKLPLAQEMIRALVRPLGGVMGPFFSFVGLEGGKVRPRAAVVAGLVAALALLAVLRGGPSASAVVPAATVTMTQAPAGGTAVDPGPGNTIAYAINLNILTTFDPTPGTDMITAEFNVDVANLGHASLLILSCPGGSASPPAATGEVRCSWSGASIAAGSYVFSVAGYATPGGDNKVDAPTGIEVCYDANGNNDCDDEPDGNKLTVTVLPSVGDLSINPNTVSPASTTVPILTPVTITWTLKDGYTCESDPNNDGNVDCNSNDVVVAPASVTVTSPTVTDSDIADETFVSVTVLSTSPGPVTLMLRTKFLGDPSPAVTADDRNPNQIGVDDVIATVTYTGPPGRLMGDVDCDNNVTAADALKILRFLAGLPVVQNEPCPDIGTPQ